MTRILVTGAAGFIGTHLVHKLLSSGYEVTSLTKSEGSVTDAATWSDLQVTDAVVHLAGLSFVPLSWEQPGAFMTTNISGTTQALNYCARTNARMIFLSSYLYGNPDRLPIAEDAPLHAPNPYALSKHLAEQVCQFYARSRGVQLTILRPFNVYGPGQGNPFLVPEIIAQVERADRIVVRDLEPKRDYVFVGDLVDAIVRAIERKSSNLTMNIGSGESHSVAELIAMVQQVWATDLPVSSSQSPRANEISDCIADIGLAKRKLGWVPTTSLIEGLGKIRDAVHNRGRSNG